MFSARRVLAALALACILMLGASPAQAQEVDPGPVGVSGETTPTAETSEPMVTVPEPDSPAQVGISIESDEPGLSQTVTIILMLTVGSLLPSLLVLTTSFTRFIIVLGLTRNALGLQTVPPTAVLIGLALFLTIFVMGPVFGQVNEDAVQPFLAGEIETSQALDAGYAPMRDFMLAQTREDDLRLFMDLSEGSQPESPEELSASVLIPAFVVSELRTAFVIGFVIFIPFLVIDLIVATVLMSLGMVMLPPIFVSLPIKLLVFVLVDGWVLIIGSMVASVNGVGL